jgi:hypothetical protein
MYKSKVLFFIVLFSICCLLSAVLHAQVDTAWVRSYNEPGNYNGANALAIDSSGNAYVTGRSSDDYVTIKYNSSGDTQWVRRYAGLATGLDWAYDIVVDDIGNVYVTGASGYGTPTSFDFATIKYNSDGDTLWVRRFNYSGNSEDWAVQIALDQLGNVYVGGHSQIGGTNDYCLIVKYDSTGHLLWSQAYSGPYATHIVVDDSSNIYSGGLDVHTNSIVTVKYNANGVLQWAQSYNASSYRTAIAVDNSGNVYVVGNSGTNILIIKYNSTGNQLWVQNYSGLGNAIAVDNLENIYVIGTTGTGAGSDYLTLKYHTSGSLFWIKTYNGPADSSDQAYSIAIDQQNNIYVSGNSRGSGTGDDIVAVKYNTNSLEQWLTRYNGPTNGNDAAAEIKVDNQGNVYVAGSGPGVDSGSDFITIKYVQTPGINELVGLGVGELSVLVYPIPSKTYFTIRLPEILHCVQNDKYEIKIFDVTGKAVKELESSGVGELRVSLDGIKNGIYFVKVNDKMVKEKLVVTR